MVVKMKTQIRKGTFESNSSSVHSLVMCNKSDYDKWEKGELFLHKGWGISYPKDNRPKENHFYTKEEMLAFLESNKYFLNFTYNTESELLDFLHENEWFDYDYFWNEWCENWETFEESFTTENGDTVIAFGYDGYDG